MSLDKNKIVGEDMKKGFTLAELLGVIVIIGVIALIITPVVTNSINDTKEKSYQKQVDIIESAAREWGLENINSLPEEDSGLEKIISLNTLLNSGKIQNSSIIDPRTNEEMQGCVIISYDYGYNQYNYEYNDDYSNCKLLLTRYIKNLYTQNNTVINNGITYNIDTIHGLINDRLGSNTIGADNGNIRYYGSSPKNYIDIGDRDSQGNVILWRIIGLFKDVKKWDGTTEDLVKIIRADSIGDYEWNSNMINNWDTASLNYELNNAINGSYRVTLDSTIINKIPNIQWSLGGVGSQLLGDVYSNDYYGFERGNVRYTTNYPLSWTGRIALMYPSDYGYASDFTKCNSSLWEYDDYANCKNTNWIYKGYEQWTLTPYVGDNEFYFTVMVNFGSGSINSNWVYNDFYAVHPVAHLNADVTMTGEGNGEKDTPFVLE